MQGFRPNSTFVVFIPTAHLFYDNGRLCANLLILKGASILQVTPQLQLPCLGSQVMACWQSETPSPSDQVRLTLTLDILFQIIPLHLSRKTSSQSFLPSALLFNASVYPGLQFVKMPYSRNSPFPCLTSPTCLEEKIKIFSKGEWGF